MNSLVDSLHDISDYVKYIMKLINRRDFTPQSSMAYQDSPSPLSHHQTISAPHMHANALEYLRPLFQLDRPHILDVGSGSGYLTACLGVACRVFETDHTIRGKVVGIDLFQDLVDSSIQVISRDYHLLTKYKRSFQIKQGDGKLGFPQKSHKELYDGIHIGAECTNVPPYLWHQLRKGGRMVLPLKLREGTYFCIILKTSDGDFSLIRKNRVRFVPLI